MTAVRLTLALLAVWRARGATERPIIAIAAHPAASSAPACGGSCEQVVASYVKWVEAAGGRAVALGYAWNDSRTDALLAQVNGVLLPGGGGPPGRSAYRAVATSLALAARGEALPVWGTCLGFEWLLEIVGGVALDAGFDAHNLSLPLALEPAAESSRMLGGDANAALRDALASEPITFNSHQAGLAPDEFAASAALRGNFTVLSTNADRGGRPFVSTMEHADASVPIFGTQWHPEKAQFEWGANADGTPYEAIPHAPSAIAASQHLANLFVASARASTHAFATPEAEQAALFYNFAPTSTTPEFEQTYFLHL